MIVLPATHRYSKGKATHQPIVEFAEEATHTAKSVGAALEFGHIKVVIPHESGYTDFSANEVVILPTDTPATVIKRVTAIRDKHFKEYPLPDGMDV